MSGKPKSSHPWKRMGSASYKVKEAIAKKRGFKSVESYCAMNRKNNTGDGDSITDHLEKSGKLE